MADPAAALKLLDVSAATAAAAEIARCGAALHDGLAAEQHQLREARARALAAAQDTSMVSGQQHSAGRTCQSVSSFKQSKVCRT
jgi:hypothetical protein